MSDENWVPLSIRGNAVAEAYHRQTQAFVESLHARVKEAEARAERAEAERDEACRMADDNAQIVRVATDERDRAEARVRVLEEALVAIRDSREGSFLATTGEGHARCVETARRALASASPAPSAEEVVHLLAADRSGATACGRRDGDAMTAGIRAHATCPACLARAPSAPAEGEGER
jgi:hypothetical protein